MATKPIPDDLFAKIVSAFLTKDRLHDESARYAMGKFITSIEAIFSNGRVPDGTIFSLLENQKEIDALVKMGQRELQTESRTKKHQQSLAQKNRLNAYHDKIKNEFIKHGISTSGFEKKAKSTNPFLQYIAIRIMESGSTRTLVTYAVALALAVNIIAGEMLEGLDIARNAAWSGVKKVYQSLFPTKKISDVSIGLGKGKPVPAPLSSSVQDETVRLVQTPYGPRNPDTGQSALDLLLSGHTVETPTNSGTLFLVLPSSATNPNGAGHSKQKEAPHRRPHHHRRHLTDRCIP
jgi:hypothetical protein